MPSDDLGGDHAQLVGHEGRIRDGDHAGAVDGADERLREPLDRDALVDGDGEPSGEGGVGEGGSRAQLLVEFRVAVREGLVDVAVEDERKHGRHRVQRRVADQQPVAEEGVRLEVGGDAEDGLADADDEAAVDDELGELGAAGVGVAAVPDEEFGQVVEGGQGEVGGEGGLPAFFAEDADADVGGLDHGDVVAAVADGGDAFVGVRADEGCEGGFLGGGAAAGDEGGEGDGG